MAEGFIQNSCCHLGRSDGHTQSGNHASITIPLTMMNYMTMISAIMLVMMLALTMVLMLVLCP
ncbi:MAG TPA: hypothetical protein VFF64_21510 [Candidatus Eremiobacteraceae bacterium]|nr:hypothetical protein [Candidatus Eremiobacteraceae bacterium]